MVEELRKIRTFIESELGLSMPESKVPLLESRLRRRVEVLGLRSLAEYSDYVLHPITARRERAAFIDAVTTHRTAFWREPEHFQYLLETALPDMDAVLGSRRTTNVWSVGCSTGEEPYSLAMALCEHHRRRTGSDFRVLATDVSRAVVEHGKVGIYEAARLAPVPEPLSRRYTRRALEGSSHKVRVVAELRRRVAFECLNLMQSDYRVSTTFDAIFIKDVLADFDEATREIVVNKLCRNLRTGGLLFIGSSESFPTEEVPLKLVAPAVYAKVA